MRYVVVIETKDVGWEIGGELGSAVEATNPANWERVTYTTVDQAFHGQDTAGAARIWAERQRQVREERHTTNKDAAHGYGFLVWAAQAYLDSSLGEGDPKAWPWEREGFKPTTPIRDLEKAGALVAAEIDRRLAAGER